MVEGVYFQAITAVTEAYEPTHSVLSTAKAFVDPHQFVFDALQRAQYFKYFDELQNFIFYQKIELLGLLWPKID